MDNRKQIAFYNLEEGFPCVKQAISYMELALKRFISGKAGCVYVVHGQGSSGKGGIIRKKIRRYFMAQVLNGKIKTVIKGEDFSIFNFKSLELKRKYKGLEDLFDNYNAGVTVIELK